MKTRARRKATTTLTAIMGSAMTLAAAVAYAQRADLTAGSTMLLDPIFQDHLVLQRERPIPVWGHAPAGAVVTVSVGSSSERTRADFSGRWTAVLPARHAGGPFDLTARTRSGLAQTAHDVLVGDVFLCSGQSNMELPVRRVGDSRHEIDTSANNTIRMTTIDAASSPEPLARFSRALVWQVAAPATVPEWSAVCFFFARELQKTTHAPIGLVHASLGGSRIESWLTAAGLRAHGRLLPTLTLVSLYARDPEAAQQAFARQWEQWWRSRAGEGAGAEPWQLSAHARDWKAAPPQLGNWQRWGVRELEDFNGLVWFRTVIHLTGAQAKAAATLLLGPINQTDETWVNGRAIGNSFGYGAARAYPLSAGVLHAGENVIVVNVASTYEGGGLLAGGTQSLRLAAGESIRLGAWEYRVVPQDIGFPPTAPWQSAGGVTTLYNAMIAPLGSFSLRGVLWYQGESNTDQAQFYQPLLEELMGDWRLQFGAELPFLVVQLPNYGSPMPRPAESDWANLREAQRLAVANDRHAALAVTIDIGEPRNLHPTDKQDVGVRLARAARHLLYGEKIPPSGPVPRGAQRRAGEITVPFGDVAGALVAYSHETPIGFELCEAAPGSCRFADARLDHDSVELVVPSGRSPTRVRYCWGDSPVCTLYDLSGFPAGPFEIAIR
ncbi:MAG TPA: sialate O-acetylesterase [Steroidobacteraceae bacterium]|nr:sialate O-acetylesterase [Steroidobacteraceae bacterium]